MADVTGLGRPLDPGLPSNRPAIIGLAIAAVSAAVGDLLQSGLVDLMVSLTTAVAVFLSWAIARELDPDHPKSAALAMLVALGSGLAPASTPPPLQSPSLGFGFQCDRWDGPQAG